MAPAPTAVASPPTIVASTGAPPPSVKTAVLLLVVSIGISLLASAALMVRLGVQSYLSAPFFLRLLFFLALDVTFAVGVWKRQGWARILVAVLLLWAVGNLSVSLIRYAGSAANVSNFAFPVIGEVLRLIAVVLLFRAESNAWFKKA
jgi:hypothetical protein